MNDIHKSILDILNNNDWISSITFHRGYVNITKFRRKGVREIGEISFPMESTQDSIIIQQWIESQNTYENQN